LNYKLICGGELHFSDSTLVEFYW